MIVKIRVPFDYNNIQTAINHSNEGDIIIVEPGIYYENIDLKGKNITLASRFIENFDNSYIEKTIIDGNKKGCAVTYENDENENSILCGFTIRNGLGKKNEKTDSHIGGGIHIGSSPTIKNVYIIENAAQSGGGVGCLFSNAKFDNVVIKENMSLGGIDKGGGGIYCLGSKIKIKNSKITDNKAGKDTEDGSGGGIYCDNSSIDIKNTLIDYNRAEVFGGGIYFTDYHRLDYKERYAELENVKIIGNSAKNSGGGIGIYQYHDYTTPFKLNLKNIQILNNKAFRGGGGGIDCSRAFFRIEDSVIKGNKAKIGGGIMINDNLKLFKNYNLQNIPQIFKNIKILENKAREGGGMHIGYYTSGTEVPILTNVEISRNEAINGGGMIILDVVPRKIEQGEHLVVSKNKAVNFGGVKYSSEYHEEDLYNILNEICKFEDNESENGEEINTPEHYINPAWLK